MIPGTADEHVIGLFGQHEPTGPRQRIEPAFGQAFELIAAVAVGEIGEHEEAQPVLDRLVESAENARPVWVAGVARQQFLGFLAAIAAEKGVQYVDHRPQMATFLDIDLEQVAQIVERRAAQTEQALLLDRGGLSVALGYDQPPQGRAVLARHLLPYLLADGVAEADPAIGHRVGEKNAPAVFGHLDHAVFGPALGIDCGGRAQIDIEVLRGARPHLAPPVEKVRLPVLQRALQGAVVAEPDIVRDPLLVIDRHLPSSRYTRSQSKRGLAPLP